MDAVVFLWLLESMNNTLGLGVHVKAPLGKTSCLDSRFSRSLFDPTPSDGRKGFVQAKQQRENRILFILQRSVRKERVAGRYLWRRAGATCRHACACHARLVTCRFGRGRRLLAPLLDESDSEGERVTQLPGLPPSRRRGRRRQSQQPTPRMNRSLSLRNKMLSP